MFHQLRALIRSPHPSSSTVHYHLDDHGRKVFCDESRCRPRPEPILPYLFTR